MGELQTSLDAEVRGLRLILEQWMQIGMQPFEYALEVGAAETVRR